MSFAFSSFTDEEVEMIQRYNYNESSNEPSKFIDTYLGRQRLDEFKVFLHTNEEKFFMKWMLNTHPEDLL